MRRVAFLAQRVALDEIAPNGSSAHAAATLAGLRAHHEVLALGASPAGAASTVVGRRRMHIPPLVSGMRQDFRAFLRDVRFARNALDRCRAFAPEVVYERSEYMTMSGLRLSRRLGIPLVLEVNGCLAHDVRAQYRSPLEPMGAQLERLKLRRADAVVTVSPGLAEILVELGAREDRIAVVPNSLPDERVGTVRSAPSEPVTIGWVGHLMRWHFDAVNLLIEAAPSVLEELPDARFLVIGGGPGLEELRARVRRAGIEDRFELPGPVPYALLPDQLARIDIGVIPEVFDYAFPVKLVEFGASGAAVIAPQTSSLDRQLTPSVEYEPTPPADRDALVRTMVSLARDADRVLALGSALQRAVRERFTWSATGRQLGAVVDRVLAMPRYDRES